MFDYKEAFSRNLGLVSEEEQLKLSETCVAIAGMGGVGGAHALALARLGVGRFRIADLDVFELANMNRQFGATLSSLGREKTAVLEDLVKDINPGAEIERFDEGIHPGNVEQFLAGADIAVDGIDFFTIGPRRLYYRTARRMGVPVLLAAPVGFGATLHCFSPDGMSFDDYFAIEDDMSQAEQVLMFGLGLTPRLLQRAYFSPDRLDLGARTAPSLAPGVFLAAGLIAAEVANLVVGRRPMKPVPHYLQFDPIVRRIATGKLPAGNRHPIQRLKKLWVFWQFPSLKGQCRKATQENFE